MTTISDGMDDPRELPRPLRKYVVLAEQARLLDLKVTKGVDLEKLKGLVEDELERRFKDAGLKINASFEYRDDAPWHRGERGKVIDLTIGWDSETLPVVKLRLEGRRTHMYRAIPFVLYTIFH